VRWAVALAFAAVLAGCTKRKVALAVAGFEGEIESESSSVGTKPFHNRMLMKGDRMRRETGADTSIVDYSAGKKWTLYPSSRTYRVFDFGAAATSDAGAAPIAPAALTGTKTGKAATIAGLRCDEYETKTPSGGTITMCLTRELYSPVALAAGAMAGMSADMGYPLRYVVTSPSGTEMWRMEVTRIDKRPIAESDLTLPPGWIEVK
jgi:hypothetical protein